MLFIPVQQYVYLVPNVSIIVNLRVDELIHSDLVAETKPEEHG